MSPIIIEVEDINHLCYQENISSIDDSVYNYIL